MKELRAVTVNQIEGRLDRSYFTKHSFAVRNTPQTEPFLVIEFLPRKDFKFEVHDLGSGEDTYMTRESPGTYLASPEEFFRKDFDKVLLAISSWTERIREDFRVKDLENGEADEILEALRAQIFSGAEAEGDFSKAEVEELRKKLDDLQILVEKHAKKLEANEYQIKEFEKEIQNIKNDLEVMPKSVWHKVAGNKLLKAIGGFLKSGEGRQLLADGVKKLLGMD